LEFGNDELHVFYTQGIRSNYLAIHHAFQPSRHQFVGMVTTNLLWETVLFAEFFMQAVTAEGEKKFNAVRKR
jgi:hypothetical protein